MLFGYLKKIILFVVLAVLCLSAKAFAFQKITEPVELEIKSYDGFNLSGVLELPKKTSIQNKAPLVIFLHSLGHDIHYWGDFPQHIKDDLNVAVLTLDLRGHGQSNKNKKGKIESWKNYHDGYFQKYPEDLIEVLKYLKIEYPEIDHNRIAVVGASLGATMAIMAGSYNADIKTVIMLSPMMEYKSFDLRLPIVKYGRKPLLFLVSKKDKYPYESSEELIKFAQGPKHLEVYPYGGHGEDLLKFQPDSKKLILEWLDIHLLGHKPEQKEEKTEEKKNEDEPKHKPKPAYKSRKNAEVKRKPILPPAPIEDYEYGGEVKESGDFHWGIH